MYVQAFSCILCARTSAYKRCFGNIFMVWSVLVFDHGNGACGIYSGFQCRCFFTGCQYCQRCLPQKSLTKLKCDNSYLTWNRLTTHLIDCFITHNVAPSVSLTKQPVKFIPAQTGDNVLGFFLTHPICL